MAGPVACNGREAELTEADWIAAASGLCASATRSVSSAQPYEAAAPTAGFRAGGVQRKAAPNLFQMLIDATADVR